MVASQATRQAMWLSSLFGNIGVPQMKPMVIYDNNQSCISLSRKPNLSCLHKACQDSSSFGVREH
jgi:hypothetical protein